MADHSMSATEASDRLARTVFTYAAGGALIFFILVVVFVLF